MNGLKVKLQIAAFMTVIVGTAVLGVWLAIHFDNFAWLLLGIPAFAVILTG